MILVNGIMVELGTFPDKTSAMRYDPNDDNYTITWLYDGDHECMAVWYLVHHIRENCGAHTPICLNIPYLPNARMDRVKRRNEVFTLKWFAEFVNTMKFDKVSVLDPHSNVAPALINNVSVVQPDKYIWQAINWIGSNPMLCYPDEGAAKRYSDLIDADYVFGIKHRNWETGKIERFELTTPEKVYGRDVLIMGLRQPSEQVLIWQRPTASIWGIQKL